MIGFLDDMILKLYIEELILQEVERSVDGYLDPSEWPSDHYTRLIEAADTYYTTFNEAELKLGKEELQLQYDILVSQCGHS